jgi:hypothetical protein
MANQPLADNFRAPVKTRTVLTTQDALAIFQIRSSISSATKVASIYGVSEKAIRDIWTGRTWAAQTWHLDKSRVLKIKPTGRPIGRRDTKPRKPRHSSKTDPDRISKPAVSFIVVEELKIDRETVLEPAMTQSMHIVCEHSVSGKIMSDQAGDGESYSESCGQGTGFLVSTDTTSSGPTTCQSSSGLKSVDEQLSDWELFRHGENERPDPFASDWMRMHRSLE